jgi:hypothetical protein
MIKSIQTCVFTRQRGSIIEEGLLINEGAVGIIDKDGLLVTDVWEFKATLGIALHGLQIGQESCDECPTLFTHEKPM